MIFNTNLVRSVRLKYYDTRDRYLCTLACKTASFITDVNIATISFDPVKRKVILNTLLNSVCVTKKT